MSLTTTKTDPSDKKHDIQGNTNQAGGDTSRPTKKERLDLKTTDKQKLEKQLCNCYSLEYTQVSKFEVAPFTALLNLLKSKYEATPEIFKTVITLLHEYNPQVAPGNKQMIVRCLRVLLAKNLDLADCLISMLPEKATDSQSYTCPLAALPTKIKPERWMGNPKTLGLLDKPDKSSEPKCYNYTTPALTAFIATQGIPSKVTSNERKLLKPTPVHPIKGADNNLVAVRMAHTQTGAPVYIYGPYNIASNVPHGEPGTDPITQQNIIPLMPTKQPGVWNSVESQNVAMGSQKQSSTVINHVSSKQQPRDTPLGDSILTKSNVGSIISLKAAEQETVKVGAKRKLKLDSQGSCQKVEKISHESEEVLPDFDGESNAGSEISNHSVKEMKPGSQQFPYTRKMVFKNSSTGSPVNVDYEERNKLADLAEMVERLPPIPISLKTTPLSREQEHFKVHAKRNCQSDSQNRENTSRDLKEALHRDLLNGGSKDGSEARRIPQRFSCAPGMVLKDLSADSPGNFDHEKGNNLAYLARMVELLPPIPIPDSPNLVVGESSPQHEHDEEILNEDGTIAANKEVKMEVETNTTTSTSQTGECYLRIQSQDSCGTNGSNKGLIVTDTIIVESQECDCSQGLLDQVNDVYKDMSQIYCGEPRI